VEKGMKALVLCGGLPQTALIKDLKSRGIETILADRNPRVIARPYADKFYQISTLDVDKIKAVAIQESVDFVITVCADQVLLVVAQVSADLGLPCYIDYETALNVSNKSYMKRIFVENNIPTSKYKILNSSSCEELAELTYPLIVKPVDSYSSRGVRKVHNYDELKEAFNTAINFSRSKTVIVEEYCEGNELSVDVYVEDGIAHILCISTLYKIPGNNKFVIHRLVYPALVSDATANLIKKTAQDIANAFNLKNTPMLIQLISDNGKISVVEFCARTGGGDKFRLIKNVTGFDIVKAVTDLTIGRKPHVKLKKNDNYIVNSKHLICPSKKASCFSKGYALT
jgi:biotin carboxylase